MGSKPLIAGPEGATFTLAVAGEGLQQRGLVGSDSQLEAGRLVRERILAALGAPTDDVRVRRLAECLGQFPKETLRCPEVCGFLEWLVRKRQTSAVDRILRDRPMRGRRARSPEERFFEVAVIAAIMERDSCSAASACMRARDEYRELRHKSARSLENDFARNRDAYALFNQVRFLPASVVTDREWSR